MSRIKIPTLVFLLVLLANIGVQSQAKSFASSLSSLLSSRNEMVKAMESVQDNVNQYENLNKFIQALEDLQRHGKDFLEASLSTSVSTNEVSMLKESVSSMSSATKLFKSEVLGLNHHIINTFWISIKTLLNVLADDNNNNDIPFGDIYYCRICPSEFCAPKISTTDVCKSSLLCGNAMPNSKSGYIAEPDIKKACTEDSRCKTEKALPLMTGILWYEVEYIIIKKLCPTACTEPTCQDNGDVFDEARLLQAYAASVHPAYFSRSWKDFFTDYQSNGGFQNFSKASSVVENYRKQFQIAQLACNTLKYNQSCPYAEMFNFHELMKGYVVKNNKKRQVKDLRSYSLINNQTMGKLKRDAMNHLKTLSFIKDINETVKTGVPGISKYFQGVAEFHASIAKADVAFIKEIDREDISKLGVNMAETFVIPLQSLIYYIMGDLVREIKKNLTQIAKSVNPITQVLDEPYCLSSKPARGVQESFFMKALSSLTKDSSNLCMSFITNKEQICSLKKVMNKIRYGQESDIDEDANRFIEDYYDYSPKLSRSDIAKNNELWSAFKDAICAFLEENDWLRRLAYFYSADLLCYRLESSLAQFFIRREDILDYHLQLIDAVTNVIRANRMQKLANNIRGKGDVLSGSELISAFMFIHLNLFTAASLYCDVLEYKNQGNSITACRKDSDGFFSENNLDSLIAYKDTSSYTEEEVDVLIPTRASFPGDTGYIDLAALGRGEKTLFRIPNNARVKLTDGYYYHFNLDRRLDTSFVEDLKLFFPNMYNGSAVSTYTEVEVWFTGGCSFPNNPVRYMLPRRSQGFLGVYQEGYNPNLCSNMYKIENPYSLCGDLPKICDLHRNNDSYGILPTIQSTWQIRLSVNPVSKSYFPIPVRWDVPEPATNLVIRGKVKLRIPRSTERGLPDEPAFKWPSSYDECCEGNMYDTLWDFKRPWCESCPPNSHSKFRGLYCEINKNQQY